MKKVDNSCHDSPKMKKMPDFLLWVSLLIIISSYTLFEWHREIFPYEEILHFAESVYDITNRIWWGVLIGILSVGLLDKIPRKFINRLLGKGGTFSGIIRATLAGVLLDLCSHGILMVGAKLYERGASLGQVMAFLIASPWNSLSLTLILWGLVGIKLTLIILFLSMLIAVLSGFIFEKLVAKGVLPKNPNTENSARKFSFFKEASKGIKSTKYDLNFFGSVIAKGLAGSRMVLRWIFFGVVLAAAIRSLVSVEHFGLLFGPTIGGLGLTLLVATILEVCSEGSMPLAADMTIRAGAPGNTMAFLMTGVSTDYTEIMAIKQTTKSWKIALFLPLVTLPQVILISYLLNLWLA